MKNWRWLLSLIVSLGCAESKWMAPVNGPADLRAKPGFARLLFIRESVDVSGTLVPIMDGAGQFVGELPIASCVGVDLPQGQHRFITLTQPMAALSAEVAAGRTYLVEVLVRFGTRTPRFSLSPLNRAQARKALARASSCSALEVGAEPEDFTSRSWLREGERRVALDREFGLAVSLHPEDGLELNGGARPPDEAGSSTAPQTAPVTSQTPIR
jgi:hypothetical protein